MKNKRSTKILSLILVLVMAFSLVPASALAESIQETAGGTSGWSGWGTWGWGGRRNNPQPEPETSTEEVVTSTVTLSKTVDDLTVTAKAPKGVLPEGAEMTVTPVRLDAVQTAVDSTEGVSGTVLAAADITFLLNDKEIQPDGEVTVTMSSAALADVENTSVVHLDTTAAALEAAPVDAELVENVTVAPQSVTFGAAHFSVYAIVLDEGSATVHWGKMNGEEFEEFDESKVIALDTTGGTVSLDVDFEGYAYLSASYQAEGSQNTVTISPTLKKVDGKWQVEKHTTNSETGEVEIQWVDLNDGDNIYVTYVVPTGTTPSGSGNENIPSPHTDKNVAINNDGTRTITLDVTGTTVEETDEVGANVLILLDRTYSMASNMASGGNRMAAAKAAVDTLVGILTGGENPGVINYALLDFYVDSRYNPGHEQDRLHSWNQTTGDHQSSGSNYWTTNAQKYNSYIQDSSYSYNNSRYSMTNWQAPLTNALTILNTRNTANQTYVIFVTDGEPNTYGLGNNVLYTENEWYGDYYMTQANYAAVAAITALPNVSLYGVFCGSSTGYTTLQNTVNNNGGKDTINGSDTPALTKAFGDIAHTIVEEMGASNVSVDDGIPSLSSVSAQTSGEAGGYEYYRLYPLTAGENGTYTYTVAKDDVRTVTAAEFAAKKDSNGNAIEEKDGTWYIEIKWTEGYPGASYNQANGVTWDLSSVSVVPGVTYRLKFKVWPSQEAYDYIANLNNGLIDPVPSEAELKAMGIEKNAQGVYYLLTNTHLKTDYSFNGQNYSDEPDETPTSEMILPTTTITVKKIWNNDLDWRQASDVRLTVTKDGQPYLYDKDADNMNAIPMSNAVKTGDHEWTQTNSTEIYISMGQMTVSGDDLDVISSGHDYTVTEPESFSYYWSLTSDLYHPMVINGTPTVLVQVKDDEVPAALKNLANNKTATDGGKDYYKFAGKLYVAQAGSNVLTAVNDRRSNLNFTKVVEAVANATAPADTLFTYTVKLENPNGKYEGDEGYNTNDDDFWFNIGEPVLDGDGNPVLDENGNPKYNTITDEGLVEGATAASGNTSYHFANVSGGKTVTIKIRAGWNVRFFNLANGTTYEIVETTMPDGFVFKKVESTVDNGATKATDDNTALKASGTIDKPNNVFTSTFTNEYKGVFYVYHSSDNTVERFPMAVNGVVVETFNIYEKTKAGTLYGGYYSDYAGKSEGFDATTLTYTDNVATDSIYNADTNPTGAHAYDLLYIKTSGKAAWSSAAALTVEGTAMVPAVNGVYYLKEVPVAYLQPYTYYTYYTASNNLADMWAISALDDLNYNDAGFYIQDNLTHATSVVSSLSIKAANSSTTVKLTAFKVFNPRNGMKDGYLSYAKISSFIGSDITIRQYWVTKDGIEVFGTIQRQLDTTAGTKAGIITTDSPYPGN